MVIIKSPLFGKNVSFWLYKGFQLGNVKRQGLLKIAVEERYCKKVNIRLYSQAYKNGFILKARYIRTLFLLLYIQKH